MSVNLYDYQVNGVCQLSVRFGSGLRRLLYVLATGAGKTHVAVALAQGLRRPGEVVLVLAHRLEIIEQTAAKFAAAGADVGIIRPGVKPRPEATIQVGSIQTIACRGGDPIPGVSLVIVDEAHHMAAPTWRAMTPEQRSKRSRDGRATRRVRRSP